MNTPHLLRLSVVTVAVFLGGCGDGDLRGSTSVSKDGRTYFVVADVDGGGCGPVLVDGKPWPYPQHAAGPIQPGVHAIKICTEMPFEVAAGTTYSFDYWGP